MYNRDSKACTKISTAMQPVEFVDGPRVSNRAWGICSLWHGTLVEASWKCRADSRCSVLHDYICDGINYRYCMTNLLDIRMYGASTDNLNQGACTKVATYVTNTYTLKNYVTGPRVGINGFAPFCSTWFGHLVEAKAKCDHDPHCSILFDYGCDGYGWRTCTGNIEEFRGAASGSMIGCTVIDNIGANIPAFVLGPNVANRFASLCSSWYGTHTEARQHCRAHPACSVIHDYGCDGRNWRYCADNITMLQDGAEDANACTEIIPGRRGRRLEQSDSRSRQLRVR